MRFVSSYQKTIPNKRMSDKASKIRVGLTHYDTRTQLEHLTQFWALFNYFARKEAKNLNCELIFIPSSDVENQAANLKSFLELNVDVLLLVPIHSGHPTLMANVGHFMELGIPVIILDSSIGDVEVTSSIFSQNRLCTEAISKHTFNQLGGQGKVAYLAGDMNVSCSIHRQRGFHDALAQYPNMKLVFEESAQFNSLISRKQAYKILKEHPDINAIITGNDSSALGVVDALEEASSNNKVLIAGYDGIPESLLAIRRGKMVATGRQSAYQMVKTSFEFALKAVHKEELPSMQLVEVELVTRDNVDATIEQSLSAMPGLVRNLSFQNEALRQEIDERKQAQETLKKYTQELENSNEDLLNFAYASSHDLQEPLRKIQMFSDRLLVKYKDLLDDQGRLYLSRIEDSATRMQQLIDDILMLSRVSQGNKAPATVNLPDIVAEVLADLETRIEEKKAVILIDPLPALVADATQMHQLFLNLLTNALKFQEEGKSIEVRISCQLLPESGLYQFSVEDNGIGIDEEDQERIFVMLERLHGRAEYGGSGIGLALCRKIVERHGGTIRVKSKLGKGSRFIFTLDPKGPLVKKRSKPHDLRGSRP